MTIYEKRIEVDVYYVACDVCGKEFDWNLDVDDAESLAAAHGWRQMYAEPDVHRTYTDYCPECWKRRGP